MNQGRVASKPSPGRQRQELRPLIVSQLNRRSHVRITSESTLILKYMSVKPSPLILRTLTLDKVIGEGIPPVSQIIETERSQVRVVQDGVSRSGSFGTV